MELLNSPVTRATLTKYRPVKAKLLSVKAKQYYQHYCNRNRWCLVLLLFLNKRKLSQGQFWRKNSSLKSCLNREELIHEVNQNFKGWLIDVLQSRQELLNSTSTTPFITTTTNPIERAISAAAVRSTGVYLVDWLWTRFRESHKCTTLSKADSRNPTYLRPRCDG